MKIENKPVRFLKGNFWMVNRSWIKKQICKLYNGVKDFDMNERELIETKIKDNYSQFGTHLFSLNGSPPKGVAIYYKEARRLIVIGIGGRRIGKHKDTILLEENKNAKL